MANDHDLQLPNDPIDGLLLWLREAEAAGLPEPTSMTLATVGGRSVPSARIVFYKGLSRDSAGRNCPRFFTNYKSRKSLEIMSHPNVALLFHWASQWRELRIEGVAEKVSAVESNEYFQTRARGSRIGAWSSPQSEIIPDRETLERIVAENEKKFGDGEIPCPPFWGGWRVIPKRIEFWQGGTNRLHDRIVFEWTGTSWVKMRLAP